MESPPPENNQTITVPTDPEDGETRTVLLPTASETAGVDNIENNGLGRTTPENARTGSEHASRSPESVSYITDSEHAKPMGIAGDKTTGDETLGGAHKG
jgi:hypothetical protein